jgi:hypothetical protein
MDTVRLLDQMRKEQGAERMLQRSDFKAMYEEANRWSQTNEELSGIRIRIWLQHHAGAGGHHAFRTFTKHGFGALET